MDCLQQKLKEMEERNPSPSLQRNNWRDFFKQVPKNREVEKVNTPKGILEQRSCPFNPDFDYQTNWGPSSGEYVVEEKDLPTIVSYAKKLGTEIRPEQIIFVGDRADLARNGAIKSIKDLEASYVNKTLKQIKELLSYLDLLGYSGKPEVNVRFLDEQRVDDGVSNYNGQRLFRVNLERNAIPIERYCQEKCNYFMDFFTANNRNFM